MIKSVTIINHRSEQITLTLRSPEESGFFIKKIDGLGAPIGTINTSAYATIDGSRFISSRSNQRNIVFHIGYLDNPTIEATRISSYKYFPVKHEVTMIFETDSKTVMITGLIETNEPDIFSKDSGGIVSVICPDPYFYSLENDIVNFSNLEKMFHFPYSNEDPTIKLTYFGIVTVEAQQEIGYNGEIPVGFLITVKATGAVGDITIFNLDTRETMVVDNTIITTMTGSGIVSGDEIRISTIKGQKSCILTRNGVDINILNSVIGSDWFTLAVGSNSFYYTSSFGASYVIFKMEYQTVYEGI